MFSLILVNDGSSNNISEDSVSTIQSFIKERFTYVSYPENRGKGYALRMGMQKSKAPYTIYTDIDFPYTLKSMLDMIEALMSGSADVTCRG